VNGKPSLDHDFQNTLLNSVVQQVLTNAALAVPDFLALHPVFNREEFVRGVDPKNERSPRALESLLRYHITQGHLLRVRRGLFASVPRPLTPKSVPLDPLLVAAKLTDDAVLAYHSALEHHGKAYSNRNEHVVLSQHAIHPFTFRGQSFRAVPFPRTAARGTRISYGLLPQERQGVVVTVATLERTMVDVLDRPDLGGGWEEIWRSLELVEFLDLGQVVDYVLRLGNATTAAKTGFFLEQHRESLMVDDKHLARLRRRRPNQPHPMDRKLGGSLVSTWNLIVPTSVIERSWEEPA
jgi:predicted transcriptional regulator of viral defense system